MKKVIEKVLERIRLIRYRWIISSEDLENRFTNIYKYGVWNGNKESRSGAGSTLQATTNIRKALPEFLDRINCQVLLDIGCGDFNWMKEIQLKCRYIGIDIVKELIVDNKRQYANDQIDFIHLNPVSDELPSGDVILCREVLFHLSNEDCQKMIANIVRSEATYLLATTNDQITANQDIRSGKFRTLNLGLPPFSFPKPVHRIPDNHVAQNRSISIWKVDDLRDVGK